MRKKIRRTRKRKTYRKRPRRVNKTFARKVHKVMARGEEKKFTAVDAVTGTIGSGTLSPQSDSRIMVHNCSGVPRSPD